MEEKAGKPSVKEAQVGEQKLHCPICGARIWLSNNKRHTRSKKHNDANYVMSEKFEKKTSLLSYGKCHIR